MPGRSYEIVLVPVRSIVFSPVKFPREVSPASVDDLAASLDEVGLIQPPIVRPTGDGKFEVLSGAHRVAAAKQAKVETIPVIPFEGTDDEAALMAIESDLRVYPPTPAEREVLLAHFATLYEAKHGRPNVGRPPKTLARRKSFATVAAAISGKNQSTVYRDLRRQKRLTSAVQEALASEKITRKQANDLTRLTPEQQDEALPLITGKTWQESRQVLRTLRSDKLLGTRAAPPPGVLERLAWARTAMAAECEKLRVALAEIVDAVQAVETGIDRDNIEVPDQLLSDMNTTVFHMGTAISETGNAIQRIRSELQRRVRPPEPSSEATRTDASAHQTDQSSLTL